MSSDHNSGSYYLPGLSHWPITASAAMGLLGFGAAWTMNGSGVGKVLLLLGFTVLFVMFSGWFYAVAKESEAGLYNKQVGVSFRWGMAWFIFQK